MRRETRMQRQERKEMGFGQALLISGTVGFGLPLLLVLVIFLLADHPVNQIGNLVELGIFGGIFWTLIVSVLLANRYRVTLRKSRD
jgi:hypothetical protein